MSQQIDVKLNGTRTSHDDFQRPAITVTLLISNCLMLIFTIYRENKDQGRVQYEK